MSNNFTDKFKGMSKAEVRMGRVPNPNLGKGAYLVNTVRMHDGRTGGFRAEVLLTCLWPIEKGQTYDGKEMDANRAGDKVSVCFFSGEYFLTGFKNFCLKAIGKESHEELEIANVVCPADKYPKLSELERIALMWEEILPAKVCAVDVEGEPSDAGVFDGQVVVELSTTEKRVNTLVDKTKSDTEDNWTFDKEGNPIFKVYKNTYFNRKIPMQEVGENLDEDGIKRFFGSIENFMELVEEDK